MLTDVAIKATPYGEQDGGFVAMYLLPTGPIHRILATLGEHGRSVPLPPGYSPTAEDPALAAVAPDIAAQARRECAEELRTLAVPGPELNEDDCNLIQWVADKLTGSGPA